MAARRLSRGVRRSEASGPRGDPGFGARGRGSPLGPDLCERGAARCLQNRAGWPPLTPFLVLLGADVQQWQAASSFRPLRSCTPARFILATSLRANTGFAPSSVATMVCSWTRSTPSSTSASSSRRCSRARATRRRSSGSAGRRAPSRSSPPSTPRASSTSAPSRMDRFTWCANTSKGPTSAGTSRSTARSPSRTPCSSSSRRPRPSPRRTATASSSARSSRRRCS